MKTLIWLDDMRNPYTGSWLIDFAPEYTIENKVVWVKNYNEFKDFIIKNGLPDTIGFDHDLGEDITIEKVKSGVNKKIARKEKKLAKSGFDCAKWLVDYCLDNDLNICDWFVQSANPVGKENINSILSSFKKFKS